MKDELERRLRKIEASLEWMSSCDNVQVDALDELEDRIGQLESTITTAGWMKYVEDRVDRLEVTGADPQPDSDGWIPHDGEGRPVDPDTVVSVSRRNGTILNARRADCWYWYHDGSDFDITYYRPAKQEAEWPQVGDYYHVISTDGEIDKHRWQGGTLDTKMLNSPLGIYPTHTKAEEAAGKIKRVMDHLREGHEVDLAKWQHNGSARIKKDTIKL